MSSLSLLAAAVSWFAGFAAASIVWLNPEWRRWTLWNARCRRGRRCADLHFGGLSEGSPDPPAGTIATLDYSCAGCGTKYRVSLLFGAEGSYTVADREIVA